MKPLSLRFAIAILFTSILPATILAQAVEPPTKKGDKKEAPSVKLDSPVWTAEQFLTTNADWNTAAQAWQDYTIPLNGYFAFRDPVDDLFGATLSTISDSVRAQLDLPVGQGLLVSNLRPDGPSAVAGLQQHDILLTLSDKPLASSEDLTKLLKAAGDAPSSLKLIRSGKPMTLQVRPIYRVTLGWVGEEKKEYFIGVSINPVDEALRVQLNFPANQGVIVTEVTKGSPAETVGIKQHDILVEIGGKVIDTPENLASLVQAGQDKPTTIKLIRAGKPMSITVTAAVRKTEATPPVSTLQLYTIRHRRNALVTDRLLQANDPTATPAKEPAGLQEQVTKLEQELRALRESMDKINESLKALAPKK